MPAEASNLIQLIKKLKQGEKRFITLELSRYKKETDLLKLYNLINNNPGISDADIRKKIKDKKKRISSVSINIHCIRQYWKRFNFFILRPLPDIRFHLCSIKLMF